MDRRNLLKLLAVSGAGAAVEMGSGFFTNAIASNSHAEWGYIGSEGPAYWGNLSAEYQACKTGQQQSPIDLQGAIRAELPALKIAYHDIPLRVLNNGHTIQVNADSGNRITLEDRVFELTQFHFHHPSEHSLTGRAYPMELHLVHKAQSGALAVLGVFLQIGKENEALKSLWAAMPSKPQPEKIVTGVKVSIANLIPNQRENYQYFGSLTTPPCSEIVNWLLFRDPIEVSQSQVDRFTKIFSLNARPIQSTNRRFLLDSLS